MSMGCWGDTCPTTTGCGLEEIENGLCNIIVQSCGASTASTRVDRDWGKKAFNNNNSFTSSTATTFESICQSQYASSLLNGSWHIGQFHHLAMGTC